MSSIVRDSGPQVIGKILRLARVQGLDPLVRILSGLNIFLYYFKSRVDEVSWDGFVSCF